MPNIKSAKKKVLVIESNAYGGQILKASIVENYPGVETTNGYDLATKMYEQITKIGAEVKYEKDKKITKDREVMTDSGTYKAKAIILATGSENRRLNYVGMSRAKVRLSIFFNSISRDEYENVIDKGEELLI